jgi:hypothetical protein
LRKTDDNCDRCACAGDSTGKPEHPFAKHGAEDRLSSDRCRYSGPAWLIQLQEESDIERCRHCRGDPDAMNES